MLKERLVTALLVVVPATAALSASTDAVRAVEECRLEPGLAAPSGSKWNYRVNRDHRRCWFLSSRAVRSHHTLLRRAASVGKHHRAASDALVQDQPRASDLQAASPPGKTDIAAAAEPLAVSQAAAASVEQSSPNLIPRIVPTIAYKATPQTVLGPTVSAARVAERTPASATNTDFVLLTGAAAALLVAGGTFYFARRNRLGVRAYLGAARRAIRGSVVGSPVASKRLPSTSPADDMNRRPLELKRDRKTASAHNLHPSAGKRGSGSVISLPHSAAWLSRPRPKSIKEPTTRQRIDA